MKLYLIRHAQSSSNVGDHVSTEHTDLTDIGYVQAERLANYLASIPLDVIIASHHKRVTETVRLILHSRTSQVPVEYDPLVIERDVGVFEGKQKDEFKKAYAAAGMDEFSFRPAKGENYEDVYKRAEAFKKKIVAMAKDKKHSHVAVVSHGAVLVCLILALLNKDWKDAYYFGVKNTSISWFDIDDSGNVKDFEISTMTHIVK